MTTRCCGDGAVTTPHDAEPTEETQEQPDTTHAEHPCCEPSGDGEGEGDATAAAACTAEGCCD
ncbi:hypothetical protein ABZ214_01250 [Streptomyces iakyrus]|uniref:hypothetical protein n=1 Tax=Streptomyces iakyrus TaxID=68219 RepID=UPI0033B1679F